MFKGLQDLLNPERHSWLKSVLYVVGIGGSIHLAALFVMAIRDGKAYEFNALLAIDLQKVFPIIAHNYWTFIGGWLLFAFAVYAIHRMLHEHDSPPHK